MTTVSPSPATTDHRSGQLREAGHDRGLHDVTAVVTAIARPVPSVLRVTARLTVSGDDPGWSQPNVAFRIHLGAAHGDASRIYTVRHYDAALAALTFDIVLHAHASPMMAWGAALHIGFEFGVTGPRPQASLAEAGGRAVALFLDATAIPALYAMLRQAPADLAGVGWVVTDDEAAFAELAPPAGLTLHRLASTDAQALVTHAVALPAPSACLVWGAGERDAMRSIRQHCYAAGLAREAVQLAGYWKRGVSNTQIDARRKLSYEQLLARGGTLADFDDLAVPES